MPLFKRKTAAAAAAERQVKPATTTTAAVVAQNLPGPAHHWAASTNQSNRSLPHSPTTPDSWGEDSDMGLPYNVLNGTLANEKRPKTLLLTELVLQDGQDIHEDSIESPLRTSSRLSKTLLEVLRDKDALSCFKAFLSSQKAEHLIQFWCDAESFHAATLTRLRTHSLQCISRSGKCRSDSLHSVSATNIPVSETLPESVDHIARIYKSCQPILQSSDKEHSSTQPLNHTSTETYSLHSLSAQNSHTLSDHTAKTNHQLDLPSLQSQDLQQRRDETESLSDQILSGDHIYNKSSKPSSIHISSHNEATQSSVNSHLGILSSVPQSASSGDTTHTSSGDTTQCQVQPTQSLRGSDIDICEPTSPKSPSEITQEDIAQKLKKSIERDAVTIFSTYIAKDAPQPIGVDDSLRSEAISKICKEDGEVDPECFVSCQRFVINKMDAEHFQSFRDSEFHCRHQVNMLTSEKMYLPDILLNENALCYFMEYMEQEGASDLMQMWLAADNFQQQLTSTSSCYDGEQAQRDAMVIYDRYFSLQATNPLGFDDKLRFDIEGNICREGGPLPDCFTKAKNVVLKILEKVYFSNYMQGHIYYRYLSDLISTVQMSEDMPSKHFQRGHKRTESDASSEHSAGSQSTSVESIVSRNTLLAVDSRKLRKFGTIEGDFSMNMDMFNPDDLWKRPDANNLSLGSVNELGQFVSMFEHGIDVEKKKGPVLFKRRKEKEKEEEEMALRIAQMIISDVNTMTRTGEKMLSKPKS